VPPKHGARLYYQARVRETLWSEQLAKSCHASFEESRIAYSALMVRLQFKNLCLEQFVLKEKMFVNVFAESFE
jgi:hypothetical protein